MRKLLILIMVVVLAAASFGAGGNYPIRHNTVQPARELVRLLQDRIGTLDDDVTTLEAMTLGGTYENIGTGDVFYVDSATGSDTDAGTTWALAKATLDAAVGLCADGNHDVIYVASKHLETLAADVTFDIDDVMVIGIGAGDQAPTFTFDTTTDEFIIDAIGVTLYNLRLVAGVADVATGIDCQDESDYFRIIGCEFPEPPTATHDFTTAIGLTTGADNGTVAYCTFINQAATPGNSYFIDFGAAAIDSMTIVGNHVNADSSGALIFSDKADTNLIIANNTLIQEDVDKLCIQLSSTATGIISKNMLCNLGGTAYLMDPGSCHLDGNKANVAIDSPSFPWPAEPAEGRYSGTGNVYYVDSGAANAGDGETWDTAVATLDAGIDLCTDDRGDTIYVAAGHAEATCTTEYADIDAGGITIIGKGNGDLRPTFTYTGGGGTLSVDNDDITIKNLHFIAAADSVLIGITVKTGAENFRIEDCQFSVTTAGTHEFDHCIDHAAGNNNFVIKNCRFQMGAAEAVAMVHFEDSDYAEIVGNRVHGDYSTACIHSDTTAADHIVIEDNLLFNGTIGGGENSEPGIELFATTSGMIVGNNIVCTLTIPELSIVADDCHLFNNYYNGLESSNGSRQIGLVAGQTYAAKCTTTTAFAEDLFKVENGPILITSFVGMVTTQLNGNGGNMYVWIDATTAAQDKIFSTTVAVEGDDAGTLWVFDLDDGQSVLNPEEGTTTGGQTGARWFCPIGTIEQLNSDGDCTGTIEWYMTYIPYVDGVVVTPQ